MSRPDKHKYIFDQLSGIAARSHDPNTKTGCKIIGPDGETRSEGYNGFPRGLEDDLHPERLERPEKYFWIEHAERNAIYNAARVGIPLKGSTIYVSWLPCMDCARAIIQSGIVRAVIDAESHERMRSPRWDEDHARVKVLFKECGVELIWWNDKKWKSLEVVQKARKLSHDLIWYLSRPCVTLRIVWRSARRAMASITGRKD